MRKKNLLLAVAATLCVSCAFVGCGSEKDSDNTTTAATAAASATPETTTAAKEENSLLGYWETTESPIPSYYFIEENQMEMIAMGMKMSVEVKLTNSTITASMLGEESTISYELDGDTLKLTEDGETTELKRITADDYNAVAESLESADSDENEDEDEDEGVNGYFVEPGVTMTVTEDDGTVVVYANDGNGTYIKSTTPPSDSAEDTTEE